MAGRTKLEVYVKTAWATAVRSYSHYCICDGVGIWLDGVGHSVTASLHWLPKRRVPGIFWTDWL